jgi:hypothetical protein
MPSHLGRSWRRTGGFRASTEEPPPTDVDLSLEAATERLPDTGCRTLRASCFHSANANIFHTRRSLRATPAMERRTIIQGWMVSKPLPAI